jgi:DNA-binding helix-hairpin-helix protein with protein kinase domain
MSAQLVSARGGPVRLGGELGRGGEGAVFDLADHPEFVAKVYYTPPDRSKASKLVAMANGCTERLGSISAWPLDTLHDPQTGSVRGFVMRRVARQKDIHVLYGPKTRLRDYPDATYRFLIHVACNLARAFSVVHDHGHVVGDVNQGGVCVSSRGTVTLVDCDSFQVRAPQQVFACDVGTPIYQPPELQDVGSFHGLQRIANHDNFGLAVLVFQTLFLARHPFSGAYQGDGDMPIERAIREVRFAYGRDAAARQMRQPPGSLGLAAVPPTVAELFERAFLEVGARGNRPAPLEWINALDSFLSNVSDCAQNPGHAYVRTLGKCPLCDLEGRAGVLLFLPPRPAGEPATVNIEDLWHELLPIIASARLPVVSLASIPVLPPPEAVIQFKRAKSRAASLMWLGIAASVLLAMTWHPGVLAGTVMAPIIGLLVRGRTPDEARNVRERLSVAQDRFQAIVGHIERERATSGLAGLETRAEALYRGLRGFPQRRTERLRNLERSRYERQMGRFLDQFEVSDSHLKGFGPGLLATLVSHGIETADDVRIEKLNGIHGFGPKRISALLEWRRQLEGRFKFNPSDPADAQDRLRVERQLDLNYASEVAELRRLADQIRTQVGPLRQRGAALSAELGHALRELAVVHATAAALASSRQRV